MALGNITINSGAWLVLKAGTYNVNSMKLVSGATIKISTGPGDFQRRRCRPDHPNRFLGRRYQQHDL